MPRGYAPDRGDLVWLAFNPQVGHEQAGYCPALVISPGVYNRRVGLALFCPVTSRQLITATVAPPNRLQATALRAAAEPERSA